VFNEHIGGSRSWIKFIVNNPKHTKLYESLPKVNFAVFDQSECLESSNLAFFYLLMKVIYKEKKTPKYSDSSLQEVIDLINNYLRKIQKGNKLVVFAVKIDNFPNLNPNLGNLLYSLWKDNKEKLSFVFTFTSNFSRSEIKEKFGNLYEAIYQNVERIDSVSNDDIIQSILHWSKKLEYDFTDKQVDMILKYSKGLPYLSKILCQEISKGIADNSLEKRCKKACENHLVGSNNDKLSIKKNGGLVLLNNIDISRHFNYQEFSVLKLLVDKSGLVVNRDEIADSLWGDKAYEKYSEWAIDKFISLVRGKLKKLNFGGEIKAKKGEGFVLLQKK
jgi:hypothetical protein